MFRIRNVLLTSALTCVLAGGLSPSKVVRAANSPPTIHSSTASGSTLIVHGVNFSGAAASVWLGSAKLQTLTQTDTTITATLPAGTAAGTYIVVVQVGTKKDDVDEAAVTIGEEGPQGPKGDTGATGPQGPKGDTGAAGAQGNPGSKGDKGDQGIQGSKGDKGDRGDQGTQGIQGAKGDKGDQGLQGFKGDQGVQGTQGLKGDKGDAGDKGDQGVQGLKGDKGDKGDTGGQGAKGDKGDLGLQGVEGAQGTRGDKGDKGDKGDQGMQGPPGSSASGPTWQDAGGGAISYSSGNVGIGTSSTPQYPLHVNSAQPGTLMQIGQYGYLSQYTTGLYVGSGATLDNGAWTAHANGAQHLGLNDSAWSDSIIFQADGGLTPGSRFNPSTRLLIRNNGDIGLGGNMSLINGVIGGSSMAIVNGNVGVGTGQPSSKLHVEGAIFAAGGVFDANGQLGAVGPQGPKGDAGPAGAPGSAGVPGPAGATGAPGVPGPQGSKGDTGLAGAPGSAGAQGLAGPQGPKGDTGATGAVGPQGPIGSTGATGPQGQAGVQGPAGPTGPQGLAGAQGPEGTIGPAGAQGPAGPAGSQGPSGPAGSQGSQGPKGDTGAIGPQGLQGPAGPQGPAGLSGLAGALQLEIVRLDGDGWIYPGAGAYHQLRCPTGKTALSAGFFQTAGNALVLSESWPSSDGSTWTMRFTDQFISAPVSYRYSLYVYCVTATVAIPMAPPPNDLAAQSQLSTPMSDIATFELFWTVVGAAEGGYRVYRSTDGGAYEFVTSVPSAGGYGQNRMTVMDQVPRARNSEGYYIPLMLRYVVKSLNANGVESGPSNEAITSY